MTAVLAVRATGWRTPVLDVVPPADAAGAGRPARRRGRRWRRRPPDQQCGAPSRRRVRSDHAAGAARRRPSRRQPHREPVARRARHGGRHRHSLRPCRRTVAHVAGRPPRRPRRLRDRARWDVARLAGASRDGHAAVLHDRSLPHRPRDRPPASHRARRATLDRRRAGPRQTVISEASHHRRPGPARRSRHDKHRPPATRSPRRLLTLCRSPTSSLCTVHGRARRSAAGCWCQLRDHLRPRPLPTAAGRPRRSARRGRVPVLPAYRLVARIRRRDGARR